MRVRMIPTVIFLAAGMLAAQTFRGGIQGTVTDSSGAAVAGAQVTVTSAETGLTRTVGTDAAGNYTATELPLGRALSSGSLGRARRLSCPSAVKKNPPSSRSSKSK